MPKIFIQKKAMVVSNQEIEVTDLQYMGIKIAEYRKKRGIKQQELADSIGVIRTTIVNIEKGKHNIKMNVLKDICKQLWCESSDLLPF